MADKGPENSISDENIKSENGTEENVSVLALCFTPSGVNDATESYTSRRIVIIGLAGWESETSKLITLVNSFQRHPNIDHTGPRASDFEIPRSKRQEKRDRKDRFKEHTHNRKFK